MKRTPHSTVNQPTSETPRSFAGKWRLAVLGFSPSHFRSKSRLTAMAKLRAKTMHSRIPSPEDHPKRTWISGIGEGTIQAQKDANKANGSAKIVWLNRMSSKNR